MDVNEDSYDLKHVSIFEEQNNKNYNLDSKKKANIDSNHTVKDANNINYKLNKLTKATEAVAKAQIDQMVNISNS